MLSALLRWHETYIGQGRMPVPWVSPAVDAVFKRAADVVGVDQELLRIAAALLLQYPVALGVRWLVRRGRQNAVHAYSVAMTTAMYAVLFDVSGLVHFYVFFAAVYGLLRAFSASVAARLVFAYALAHLSIVQLLRQFETPGVKRVDHTGALMVLVMKATQLGWNVRDGAVDPARLAPAQASRAIHGVPPLLEYLGYLMFSPSFLIGPSFEMAEFRTFVANGPPFSAQPSSTGPALRALAKSLTFMALFAAIGAQWSYAHAATAAFAARPLWQRLCGLQLAAFAARCKFYGGFKMSEGACVLAGLGFNGFSVSHEGASHEKGSSELVPAKAARNAQKAKSSKKPETLLDARSVADVAELAPGSAHPATSPVAVAPDQPPKTTAKWNRVAQVNIRQLEAAASFRAVIANWNIQTANWLKHYVYFRVSGESRKPSASAVVATYTVSAVWHGFYPGYYLTFLTGALCTIAGNKLRWALRDWAVGPNGSPRREQIYGVAGWLLTQFALSYAVAPFLVLSVSSSLAIWRMVGYYVHFGILAVFVADWTGLLPRPRQRPLHARHVSASRSPGGSKAHAHSD